MCRTNGLTVIALGAILVLAPVVTHGFTSGRDKERIAAFYERNTNSAILPPELKPSEFASYDWSCFSVGAAMVFIGIARSKNFGLAKPGAWETKEV